MKAIVRLVIAAIVLFALLQLVRPGIPAKPATAEVQAPPQIRQILDRSCYSCHSDQRRLSWFDHVVPAYWLVRRDILTARAHLDFSTLGARPATAQKATLYEAANFIQLGAMPLPSFTQLHPEAKVAPEDLAALKAYLAPWTSIPNQPNPAQPPSQARAPAPVSLSTVQPEFNGVPFDATFENWRLISITDRGDNYTFRFVLGNDIAVKAAQSGRISPWPDGARFAKIAWQQELGNDGLVHPGNFVQVELMLKDAQQYKSTDGWGWGRWRGLDLKPYGTGANFVNECTTCHMPVSGNDHVYTLPITPARVDGTELVNNAAAALPASLPYQPLGRRVITMYVDPALRTTAILFGNEAAMQAAQPRDNGAGSPRYPAGAVLALVTWTQRDDPHWFGARIPHQPLSVEFVELAASGRETRYRRFGGPGFVESALPATVATPRMNFILNLPPARLP
jgi:mono/diheme cytochrome c family protein